MTRYNYAYANFNPEHQARAVIRDSSISTKFSIEICNFIRGKKLQTVKEMLKEVTEIKRAIPFKRFTGDLGHKKKIGPGKYPVKASKAIIALIESAEANAQFKGLNTSNLMISHICAHKCSIPWHYGRQRRRRMKRTNVEIVIEEGKETKKKETKEKPKKDDPKKEVPKATPKKEETNVPKEKKVEVQPKSEEVKEKKEVKQNPEAKE